LKAEATEISNLLTHVENYLNQYRGVMPGENEDFYQANFEDRFFREL